MKYVLLKCMRKYNYFNLGVLIDFISIPVTVGFTSATSVIIAVSQLKGLLGLKFESSSFLDCLLKVYQNIGNYRANDTILGVTSIIILLMLRVNILRSITRLILFFKYNNNFTLIFRK